MSNQESSILRRILFGEFMPSLFKKRQKTPEEINDELKNSIISNNIKYFKKMVQELKMNFENDEQVNYILSNNLTYATNAGNLKMVKYLVEEQGINVNDAHVAGRTFYPGFLLDQAMYNNNKNISNYLINKNPSNFYELMKKDNDKYKIFDDEEFINDLSSKSLDLSKIQNTTLQSKLRYRVQQQVDDSDIFYPDINNMIIDHII